MRVKDLVNKKLKSYTWVGNVHTSDLEPSSKTPDYYYDIDEIKHLVKIFSIKYRNATLQDLLEIAYEKDAYLFGWNKSWKQSDNISYMLALGEKVDLSKYKYLLLVKYQDDNEYFSKYIGNFLKTAKIQKVPVVEHVKYNGIVVVSRVHVPDNVDHLIIPVQTMTIGNYYFPIANMMVVKRKGITTIYGHPQFIWSFATSVDGVCTGNRVLSIRTAISVLRNMNYNSRYTRRVVIEDPKLINEVALQKIKEVNHEYCNVS